MTVKMSSEHDSGKSAISETNEKSGTEPSESEDEEVKKPKDDKQPENNIDKKPDDDKSKDESAGDTQDTAKKADVDEKDNKDKAKTEVNDKENDTDKAAAKDEKKDVKKDEEEEEVEDEEEEKTEEEEEDEEEAEADSATEKPKNEKKTAKKVSDDAKEEKDGKGDKVEFEEGSGTALGDIPRVDASISRFKNDDLKLLHRLLFDTVGKSMIIKKNIRKFNGFTFKKGSDEYKEKIETANEFEVKQLKSICEMLDLQKSGSKDDIVERIINFLLEPKDTAPKPAAGGRPKRTAAVRANNRGYSSHDDYSSDEKQAARGRRDKGRRPNLKDESSSESDEDFQPSDESDEQPQVKRKRPGRKKQVSEDELSEASGATSEDSDDEPRSKKRKPVKAVNNKVAKGKGTGRGRGRPPLSASAKKSPGKRGRKPKDKETSEEEEEESDRKKDEEGSSSEDEPLVKKAKKEPPTDDEIKAYIKKILEGANLEEITMKTVCEKVYSHYPDFDLAHKKDFIKSTVKCLIST